MIYKNYGKLALDFLFAAFLLVSLSMFFVFVALLIIFSDGFPIFYTQTRIGRHAQPFQIIKFRTMIRNAELTGSTTYQSDHRLLWGASMIRKLKIDELPQLINIIRGDMSLVGPRPTVEEDFIKMSSHQRSRFTVRPGLTGLAQISGNTRLKWPQRIEYDLEYISDLTFWQDLRIILLTVTKMFTNRLETNPPTDGEW